MRSTLSLRLIFALSALTIPGLAQVAPSKPFTPPEAQEQPPAQPQPQPQQPQQQPRPAQPNQAAPAPAPGAPAPAPATQPQVLPPSDAPKLADTGSFMLPNATLT